MDDKTLTDFEMMIFASSFVLNKKKLSKQPGLRPEQIISISYNRAIADTISIRENYQYLYDELNKYESFQIEREVLRKIVGLPPKE